MFIYLLPFVVRRVRSIFSLRFLFIYRKGDVQLCVLMFFLFSDCRLSINCYIKLSDKETVLYLQS